MDVLDIQVSRDELKELDEDTRTTWPEGGMTCPVQECRTSVFTRYQTYLDHWQKSHVDFIDIWHCSYCGFKGLRKNFLYRHLMSAHFFVKEKASEEAAITTPRREPNRRYLDPGLYQLPVRPTTDWRGTARQRAAEARRSAATPAATLARATVIPRDEVVEVDISASGDVTARKRRRSSWLPGRGQWVGEAYTAPRDDAEFE